LTNISKNTLKGKHLFSKIISNTFSRAVITAVLVSLYLSANIWMNYFAFSLLKFYFKSADRCSTVFIASIKTNMFGSSSNEVIVFKIFE
jgi:hypothetical protein